MKENIKKDRRSTRSALLSELKQEGPETADVLAKKFNLTPMAVRQHLYALEEEGDVEHVSVRQPVGRPRKMWGLTEKANSHFSDNHAVLAVELIDTVRRTFGEEGLNRLIEQRSNDQKQLYADEIGSRSDLAGKLEILAGIRSREGYMAAVCAADRPNEYLFVENHCPVCEAAKACTNLCASELEVFQAVLGAYVEVERQDHILLGARRCVYLCRIK